ncbi:hypothetical protein EI427_08510 [Flammeovirga pectinis]|uniref:DUF8201 domain-containing protein n=1 Tax=Flammeovirga pectinis TaxID=2494373 RepID=A0A3S9P265_9BACT|nr:hypothetical protein [Flammeovirga pectinis]AZQ62277.1 hypothetical protein EI427_08510 [Flammeovirga pectinis]
MLISLLILLLVLINTVGIGLIVVGLFKTSNERDLVITSFIGSFVIMLLLAITHFFVPINELTLIPFTLLSCIILYVNRKVDYKLSLSKEFIFLLIIFIFYLIGKGTQYPSWTDSNLYHAQVIQWYNKYPITKGIANLFCAYGLNSFFHLFAAQYTFLNISNDPLPNIGILYFELMFLLFVFSKIQEHTNYILIIPCWIFVGYWNWESSPSPDIVVSIIISIGLIIFSQKKISIEEHLFCILSIILIVTIKQSGAIYSLLIFPYLGFLKPNKKHLYFLLTITVVTFLTWVPRNLILSGYPLYPLTIIDFVDLKHQVPKELVNAWTIQITYFARLPIDSWREVIGQPFTTWIPNWFLLHRKTDRLLMIVTLISLIYSVFIFNKQDNKHKAILCIIYIGLTFWIVKTPTMRFGYSYMLMLFTICLKAILKKKKNTDLIINYSLAIIIIIGISFSALYYNWKDTIIFPGKYKKTNTNNFLIDQNVFISVPIDDYCKDTAIPCMYITPESTLKAFSNKISDGFYQSHPSEIDIEQRGY